jgi:hypothetical protein
LQVDGSRKDEYRFKLNIAMGQYADAARDAMEMARLEQVGGCADGWLCYWWLLVGCALWSPCIL